MLTPPVALEKPKSKQPPPKPSLPLKSSDPRGKQLHDLNERFEQVLGIKLEHSSKVQAAARRMAETAMPQYYGNEHHKQNLITHLKKELGIREGADGGFESLDLESLIDAINTTLDRNGLNRIAPQAAPPVFLPRKSDSVFEQEIAGKEYECANLLGRLGALTELFEGATPEGRQFATDPMYEVYRECYYTVKADLKVLHMLYSQLSVFGGSDEFENDRPLNFEYWIYLMSTITRMPEHSMQHGAPKPYTTYLTAKSAKVPWNNQFNISFGYHEYENWNEIPEDYQGRISKAWEEMSWTKAKYDDLRKLIGVDPTNLGARNVWKELKNENDRKWFLTFFLELPWSRRKFEPAEGAFSTNAGAFPYQLRDPAMKLALMSHPASDHERVVDELGLRGHVVGRHANVLPDIADATKIYKQKLENFTVEELEKTFRNIDDDNLNWAFFEADDNANAKGDIIETIAKDAQDKTTIWHENAIRANKPIYSGPSGHTLGYLNMYARAAENARQRDKNLPSRLAALARERARAKARIPNLPMPMPMPMPEADGKPNLAMARLVMLAALIGNKEHHTYDEVLISSHGISMKLNGRTETLAYQHPHNYADMMEDKASTQGVSSEAATKAKDEVVNCARTTMLGEVDAETLVAWQQRVLDTSKKGVLDAAEEGGGREGTEHEQ